MTIVTFLFSTSLFQLFQTSVFVVTCEKSLLEFLATSKRSFPSSKKAKKYKCGKYIVNVNRRRSNQGE
jgi:hypothetical protein